MEIRIQLDKMAGASEIVRSSAVDCERSKVSDDYECDVMLASLQRELLMIKVCSLLLIAHYNSHIQSRLEAASSRYDEEGDK